MLGERFGGQSILGSRKDPLYSVTCVSGMVHPMLVGDSMDYTDKMNRHAGMPNPTQETRIMLAIVYYAALVVLFSSYNIERC